MNEHDHLSTADVPDGPMLSRAAWVRILPFATYLLFIIVADLLERMGFAASSLRWLYGVKIGAVVLVLALFWREYEELATARLSGAAAALALATGLVVLW